MTGAETLRGPARLFWGVKARLAVNYVGSLRRFYLVHVAVGVGVLLFLLVGGYELFDFIFRFLKHPRNQPFGEPLLKRLIGMLLLAFFSMLAFSNLIVLLTTTYISREVEFYMSQPIRRRTLFFCKLAESTLYSSWAFVILTLPFFLALGDTSGRGAPGLLYLAIAALLPPFLAIPAALGAMATLILTAYFPAKKTVRFAVALAGGAVVVSVGGARLAAGARRVGGEQLSIARVMDFISLGDHPWLPSTWLARGMRAGTEGQWSDVLFWWAMLMSTALMGLQFCHWLAGPLYYRGFCNSRTTGSPSRRRQAGLFGFFDRLARPLPSALRALVVKDMTVFWRDPAQWGQLMVLFGLLFIYVANLGSAAELSRIPINRPIWQSLTSLFNIGATCFVLSILTTRFYYPMLSLEGKQQWVIGLAPLKRTRLVWVKYGVCWGCSLALTLPLILLSCAIIRTDGFVTALSIVTILAMSLGLNSLAIGLGALMPNFVEDNPARIANGLGGTINVILSLIYIGLTIVLEGPLVTVYVRGELPLSLAGLALFYGSVPAWAILQCICIVAPMRLGLRHWSRLEF